MDASEAEQLYFSTVDPASLYGRRTAYHELLAMSRTQRRARGIKAERAQLEHELGAIEYIIEKYEASTATPPGIGAGN